MTAHTTVTPQRRGACPGLSAPMPTGDGLLVRLAPVGTISPSAFAALCAAARTHGNGIIEITSRGSVQVRGLNAASAPRFAARVAALGVAAEDGIPILCNPLAGLDDTELFDITPLAADLRGALAQKSMAGKLSAKISVALDQQTSYSDQDVIEAVVVFAVDGELFFKIGCRRLVSLQNRGICRLCQKVFHALELRDVLSSYVRSQIAA